MTCLLDLSRQDLDRLEEIIIVEEALGIVTVDLGDQS